MTVPVKFSATSSASAATSLTVSLGGTPSVGDLVVVFMGCDNQIVTHQPGYNTATQWAQLVSLQCPNSGTACNTLSAWHHTWTASDSGSTVTFTFSPAPTLGLGDKDVSTVNAIAVAVVLTGPAAHIEATIQAPPMLQPTVPVAGLKKAAELTLVGGYQTRAGSLSNSDSGATQQGYIFQNLSLPGQALTVYSKPTTPVKYSPTLTADAASDLVAIAVSISSSPNIYVAPVIQEADQDIGTSRLMYRYRPLKGYTVLNNGGTFTATRYNTTDQLAAATQVFTNDSPIVSADRTNIINSGVGGEFRATA